MTPDQIMHLVRDAFSTRQYDCVGATLAECEASLARAISYRKSLDGLLPDEWRTLWNDTHAQVVRDAKATNEGLVPQYEQTTEAIRFLRELSSTLATDSPANEPTQTALKYLVSQLEACAPIAPRKKPKFAKFQVDTIHAANCNIHIATMNVEHARRRQEAHAAIVAAQALLAAAVTRHAASG